MKLPARMIVPKLNSSIYWQKNQPAKQTKTTTAQVLPLRPLKGCFFFATLQGLYKRSAFGGSSWVTDGRSWYLWSNIIYVICTFLEWLGEFRFSPDAPCFLGKFLKNILNLKVSFAILGCPEFPYYSPPLKVTSAEPLTTHDPGKCLAPGSIHYKGGRFGSSYKWSYKL